MDSCEHEYLKSWQRHLAELVCHSPTAERQLGRVGSAGRGLLESSGLQILSKQLAAKNENNHSAQNNAVAKSDFQV